MPLTFDVLCLLVATLTILQTNASPTCEPIKIPLCQRHLPYNMTMFPNALEQFSQKHARQKIEFFRGIVSLNCSKEAGFFLCSYHLPICAPSFKTRPIRPCRSVCEKVMADCMPTIRKFEANWPEDVKCNELPSYNSDVCVTPESFINTGSLTTSSCKHSRPPRLSFQLYQENSYRFVLKVRIQSSQKNGSERILSGKVHRILQKGLIDLKKGDTIRLYRNITCDYPRVIGINADYLVAGHEDLQQQRFYLYPETGVVETWERVWVAKIKKWQKRLAVKRPGQKINKKYNTKRRKDAISFASPDP
ncbi:secreted frizzled-related protein 3-like [Montipora capricornis]|uniref:secreted frizzled-related protein 3-like n=1 Tax=Montipora capricornis TaxID=246305 RepID=UPI0035F1046C